jgi:hypothetical protein
MVPEWQGNQLLSVGAVFGVFSEQTTLSGPFMSIILVLLRWPFFGIAFVAVTLFSVDDTLP